MNAIHTPRRVNTTFPEYSYEDLRAFMTRMTGDEKHSFAATSTLDVLWALYDRVLAYDPVNPMWAQRDRFLLSKGHGPMAYYAVLAAKGFFPVERLDEFGTFNSILGHHPDRVLVPGVEISSGSLGHGLGIGVGMALGGRIKDERWRVVVLAGDGELDEGSNHEAIAVAGRFGLEQLTAVVIDNESARHGWPGGIAARFGVEGWATADVDGRDHSAIEDAMSVNTQGRPLALIAHVEGRDG